MGRLQPLPPPKNNKKKISKILSYTVIYVVAFCAFINWLFSILYPQIYCIGIFDKLLTCLKFFNFSIIIFVFASYIYLSELMDQKES